MYTVLKLIKFVINIQINKKQINNEKYFYTGLTI